MKSSEVVGNLRNSSDVFVNLRKISEICRQVLKITFQHFWIFLKSSEIVGSLRKSSEVFGKNRKISESSQNDLPTLLKIFENFRKSSEVFGNARKTSETLGKFSNVIGGLWKIFILFQSLTPVDWRSNSRILICNLHWYYAFCTGITLFQESITRSVYLVLGWWVNRFAWINWIPRDWFLFAPRSWFTC